MDTTTNIQTSFDKRIVRYEEVHSIRQADFDALCWLIDPSRDKRILDLGAGYGACTRELIKHYPEADFSFTLADNSEVQLGRSRLEIPETLKVYHSPSTVDYVVDDIIQTQFAEELFDVVIAKMVLHEIKKPLQLVALQQIRRLLRPNGKLIIWDLYLNKETQSFFQSIITEKDRLCDFETLYSDRYFLTGKEMFELLNQAGFSGIQKEQDILTPVITKNRLRDEFKNNRVLLESWHLFIRTLASRVDRFTLFDLSFRDFGEYVSLIPPKALVMAHK